ncbi:AraC family transcriptional regulator [Sphingomonas sp. 1P06PA]|uniref:helix-turn-helix domain-containing protein n=1 Tax=Sphingomonas sp. 1P06PA TaxID=554121 RepID=UPI0039A49A1C
MEDGASAIPQVGLRYCAPAPELRRYISSYYLFYADLPQVVDMVRADLAQMRFMIAGHGAYMFADGVARITPEAALLGPTLSATRFDIAGPVLVFGISLLPAGWTALVREDASRHTSDVVDATQIFGSAIREAVDAMRDSLNPQIMVQIADALLRPIAAQADDPPLWFTKLADRWLLGSASPKVDDFVAELGLSARQVERLTKRSYGGPPKLIARKYRALRAASLLGREDIHWQDAAGEGYYDQSHFIRDFKQFTGLTPRQFQANPTPVTRLMLQRRDLAAHMPKLQMFS